VAQGTYSEHPRRLRRARGDPAITADASAETSSGRKEGSSPHKVPVTVMVAPCEDVRDCTHAPDSPWRG
jgi:hypothetical protein